MERSGQILPWSLCIRLQFCRLPMHTGMPDAPASSPGALSSLQPEHVRAGLQNLQPAEAAHLHAGKARGPTLNKIMNMLMSSGHISRQHAAGRIAGQMRGHLSDAAGRADNQLTNCEQRVALRCLRPLPCQGCDLDMPAALLHHSVCFLLYLHTLPKSSHNEQCIWLFARFESNANEFKTSLAVTKNQEMGLGGSLSAKGPAASCQAGSRPPAPQ